MVSVSVSVSFPFSFSFSFSFVGKAATKPTRAAARTPHEARMTKPVELGLGRNG